MAAVIMLAMGGRAVSRAHAGSPGWAALSGNRVIIPTPTPYEIPVRSIDTMKQSRDLARQELDKPGFQITIDQEVADIAATHANYIAIDTPYDAEFLPYLTEWVDAARANNLHVWFRGNFSGWEGWFDYPKITAAQHTSMTAEFINANPTLFQDGDIFTACPECENGALGDPRQTGQVAAYQAFLLQDNQAAAGAFAAIHKSVTVNYDAMNYDVASLVMTPTFTKEMGGVVTVDHYVDSPVQTVSDLNALALKTGGKVVLGEVGAPIPDLQGTMTEQQQADWIQQLFSGLQHDRNVIAVNYWDNVSGSTALWNDDLSPRQAVGVITQAYAP